MTGNRGAVVLVVGFAGLLLVLAGASAWQGTSRFSHRGGERARVEAAARAFVKAYGTFDYRDPAGYRAHLLTLSTGALQAALAESDVDPVALAHRQTISTWVLSVQVTALARSQATAVLAADQERAAVDPATGSQRVVAVRQRMICRLTRVGGRWLVAEVRLLGEEPQGSSTRN